MKMNSKIKKKLALVLSAAMVFTTVPMSAMAEENKYGYTMDISISGDNEISVGATTTVYVKADVKTKEVTPSDAVATSSDAAKKIALEEFETLITNPKNINISDESIAKIDGKVACKDGEASFAVKGLKPGKVTIRIEGYKKSLDITVVEKKTVNAEPNVLEDGKSVTASVRVDAVNGVLEDVAISLVIDAKADTTTDIKEAVVSLGSDPDDVNELLKVLADSKKVTSTTISTNVGDVTLPAAAFAQVLNKDVANFTVTKDDLVNEKQTFTVGFINRTGDEEHVKDVRVNLSLKSNFKPGEWVKVVSDRTDNRGKKEVDIHSYISFYMNHLSKIEATKASQPYSYAGSGSGSSGGGSAASSMAYGRTMSPQAKGPFTDVSYAIIKQFLPSYVLDGKWSKSADGSWSCLNPDTNTKYAGRWAAIYNPYSTDVAANAYGWFYFALDGKMQTGWFTDPATGLRYYLNPNSDGTLGNMATGWKQIAGQWYYFSDVSDGTRGHLLTDTITPDGKTVDANGVWVQ